MDDDPGGSFDDQSITTDHEGQENDVVQKLDVGRETLPPESGRPADDQFSSSDADCVIVSQEDEEDEEAESCELKDTPGCPRPCQRGEEEFIFEHTPTCVPQPQPLSGSNSELKTGNEVVQNMPPLRDTVTHDTSRLASALEIESDGEANHLADQLAAKEASLQNEIRLSKRLSQELEECKVQLRRKDCLLGERLLAHGKLQQENEKLEQLLKEQEKELAENKKAFGEMKKENGNLRSLLSALDQSEKSSCQGNDRATASINSEQESSTQVLERLLEHVKNERLHIVTVMTDEQLTWQGYDYEQQAVLREALVRQFNEELEELKAALEQFCRLHHDSDNPFNGNKKRRKRLAVVLDEKLLCSQPPTFNTISNTTASDLAERRLSSPLMDGGSLLTSEVLESWQKALVSAISDKDVQIAEIEIQCQKTYSQADNVFVAKLQQEKKELLRELKCQVPELLRLVSGLDEGEEQTALKMAASDISHHPLYDHSEAEIMAALQHTFQEQDHLFAYVDELVAHLLDRQPDVLEAMPRLQVDRTSLRRCVCNKLLQIHSSKEREHQKMKSYLDSLLQRISACNQGLFDSLPALQAFTSECSDTDTTS